MSQGRRRGSAEAEVRAFRVVEYALEQLFFDQDRDWVADTIAAVLAWVPGKTRERQRQPFRFEVAQVRSGGVERVNVDLSWDVGALEELVPGVQAHARRFRSGRTVQREHVTELAAYGLTFVAISALMPGRRVVGMQAGSAPDILFDVTPGALRGVETAGRASGGWSVLERVRGGPSERSGRSGTVGKAVSLLSRTDLKEIHLSLWCGWPRVSMMEQLKP